MTNVNTLNVPVSITLSGSDLLIDFEHPRVSVKSGASSLTADLALDDRERVVFEATDFVAHGTTYRVRALARSKAGDEIEWERHSGGCRSPYMDGPHDFDVTFEAVPASTSAAKSTTHTTIIIKKGKPQLLQP